MRCPRRVHLNSPLHPAVRKFPVLPSTSFETRSALSTRDADVVRQFAICVHLRNYAGRFVTSPLRWYVRLFCTKFLPRIRISALTKMLPHLR